MPGYDLPLPSPRFTRIDVVDAGHRDRPDVEAFIAGVYRRRHGAALRQFLPRLLAFRGPGDSLQAAVGLRCGSGERFFVEQYLDAAAEVEIGRRLGHAVERRDIVEVGNFASLSSGDARECIVQITHLLHRNRVPWVLFAATRELRNAFDRLRLGTVAIAEARPERLHAGAGDWGSYYDTRPQVLFGDIVAGHAFLQRLERRMAAVVPSDELPCMAVAK